MIQSNCPHQSTFDPKALHALQIFGSLSATMSIVMMMCVVYCIRRRYDTILKRTNNVKRDLQNFMKKQKRFTLTTFMSCIVTLFLHVIPSFVLLLCTDMQRQSCVSFGLFSNLLSYLNSLNMPLLFFYRQDDLPPALIEFCDEFNFTINVITLKYDKTVLRKIDQQNNCQPNGIVISGDEMTETAATNASGVEIDVIIDQNNTSGEPWNFKNLQFKIKSVQQLFDNTLDSVKLESAGGERLKGTFRMNAECGTVRHAMRDMLMEMEMIRMIVMKCGCDPSFVLYEKVFKEMQGMCEVKADKSL
uniref:Uncharacterized protein n=1 Tax=Setaria digitata TaxID=48799 RepID=A0A915Q469_9BILA